MRTEIHGKKVNIPEGYYRVTDKKTNPKIGDLIWTLHSGWYPINKFQLELPIKEFYAVIRKGTKPQKVVKSFPKNFGYIKVTSTDDIAKYNLKEGSKITIEGIKYTIVRAYVEDSWHSRYGLMSDNFIIGRLYSSLEKLIGLYLI